MLVTFRGSKGIFIFEMETMCKMPGVMGIILVVNFPFLQVRDGTFELVVSFCC